MIVLETVQNTYMQSVGRKHNFMGVRKIEKSHCLLSHICVFVNVTVRLEHPGFCWTDFSLNFIYLFIYLRFVSPCIIVQFK
jgi:hypothetical protein